jgi:enoyl-CoA hydratase
VTTKYPAYESLKLDYPAERVLRITMSRGKVNAMNYRLHKDIASIWRLVDRDMDVNAAIVTGEGDYFSAGGDFRDDGEAAENYNLMLDMMKDARDIVENMVSCNKPIISAINGPAAGGGLAVALLADISIASKTAKLVDAHTRLGIAAGDHAALIWPILCGMAKAKYYLLTCQSLTGEEAERIGLISLAVDRDEVQKTAIAVASSLAAGAQTGIRFTKLAINGWLKQAWPIFESSMALEQLSFLGPDLKEGMASHLEKRRPRFDARSPV